MASPDKCVDARDLQTPCRSSNEDYHSQCNFITIREFFHTVYSSIFGLLPRPWEGVGSGRPLPRPVAEPRIPCRTYCVPTEPAARVHACTARRMHAQHAHPLHRRAYVSYMCLVAYDAIAVYAYLGRVAVTGFCRVAGRRMTFHPPYLRHSLGAYCTRACLTRASNYDLVCSKASCPAPPT